MYTQNEDKDVIIFKTSDNNLKYVIKKDAPLFYSENKDDILSVVYLTNTLRLKKFTKNGIINFLRKILWKQK